MKDINYCVFILCYNRPKMQKTFRTLKNCGYSGNYKIILGDDEPFIDDYIQQFGKSNVEIFNKSDYEFIDKIDTFDRKNCVVYARNAVFDIAEKLGYEYFIVMDDDYRELIFRFNNNGKLSTMKCTNPNKLFLTMFELLNSSDKITCTALAQNGDYIGGVGCQLLQVGTMRIRKAMNVWFCSTKKRFWFTGSLNEDATAYTTLGSRGCVFLTIQNAAINQMDTQELSGGLTDIYLDLGTYVKSFYSVMSCPSAVKISIMGDNHFRIHHRVNWENCVPKIISDKYKK